MHSLTHPIPAAHTQREDRARGRGLVLRGEPQIRLRLGIRSLPHHGPHDRRRSVVPPRAEAEVHARGVPVLRRAHHARLPGAARQGVRVPRPQAGEHPHGGRREGQDYGSGLGVQNHPDSARRRGNSRLLGARDAPPRRQGQEDAVRSLRRLVVLRVYACRVHLRRVPVPV